MGAQGPVLPNRSRPAQPSAAQRSPAQPSPARPADPPPPGRAPPHSRPASSLRTRPRPTPDPPPACGPAPPHSGPASSPWAPPYHALGVHEQQVLGLPGVHAREDVLPGVGYAVAHQEVPIGSKQLLRRPSAHLAMVPGLLPQLLLRGGDGGPAGRGTGPLVLQGKGRYRRVCPHRTFVQLESILEGSCKRGRSAGGRGGQLPPLEREGSGLGRDSSRWSFHPGGLSPPFVPGCVLSVHRVWCVHTVDGCVHVLCALCGAGGCVLGLCSIFSWIFMYMQAKPFFLSNLCTHSFSCLVTLASFPTLCLLCH